MIKLIKDKLKQREIEKKKELSKILGKSRKMAKEEFCHHCGKKCSGFCKSHTVPEFILKNIDVNGEVYNSNRMINMPLVSKKDGVGKAGTFNIICRKCDSNIFSDYENPNNYDEIPTDLMISQIAMKNYLKSISKRKFEIPLYNNIDSDYGLPIEQLNIQQTINNIDLLEYIEGYKKAKKAIDKELKDEYYLFFYEKLDYVVPIAYQGNISIIADFDGNIVNDVHNTSLNYKIKYVHMAVFPMEESSVVMLFVDSYEKRYRKFYQQFRKLSLEDQLSAINFLIFSLTEDYFINMNIDKRVLKNRKLKLTCRKTPNIIPKAYINDMQGFLKKQFSFEQMSEIPNLLSRQYKVR